MLTPTRVQLPAWLLQVQTPSRGGGHRGENYIHAGDAYFQKRQDDPADQMYNLEHEVPSASHHHKENENFSGGGRDQFQFQHPVTNSGLHFQKLIQMLGKMMLQKRGREPHLRSSDQQPQNLPQCALPYQRLHQSPRIAHPYLQYQQEKTAHGLVQAKCQGTFSRTEIG